MTILNRKENDIIFYESLLFPKLSKFLETYGNIYVYIYIFIHTLHIFIVCFTEMVTQNVSTG